jgi:hypothetical protein
MISDYCSLPTRLIDLIENRADTLTIHTVEKLQTSPRTRAYQKLSYQDLYSRVHDVYGHFGRWLLERTDDVVEASYTELGVQRFKEGIPLAEVLWALVLTKYQLLHYARSCSMADSAIELYRWQEFDGLVNQFFDRAACYVAQGYEARLRGRNQPVHVAG